jgi:3-demethoxyubiquinol 3-hydroxylase
MIRSVLLSRTVALWRPLLCLEMSRTVSTMECMRNLSLLDRILAQGAKQASLQFQPTAAGKQALPEAAHRLQAADLELTDVQRQHSGALMRVNHVGEICAQALYSAQSLVTQDPALRRHFLQAAQEEDAHLKWTASRLAALGTHASHLNPLWAAGAFGLGLLAGKVSDSVSLGFVVETERQVEEHLASHLKILPEQDQCSRAVVSAMQGDEIAHAEQAQALGAQPLPAPVRFAMKLAAKVMTTVAYRL